MSEPVHSPSSAQGNLPASAVPERIGRYDIVRRIGQGGFAEVYLAQDPATFAPLALKVLRSDIDPRVSEQVRARFLAEEKISKAIGHPAVVRIRETSPAGEQPCFIAMDFVEGLPFCEHFQALLRASDAPSEEAYRAEIARLSHQVAEAMTAAHERGIVHRDLKPENVLVCSSPDGGGFHVKILDFGIAKAPVRLFCVDNAAAFTRYWTALGTVMGSPPFMAPEQNGAAHTVNGKADVYALGIMVLVTLLKIEPTALELHPTALTLEEDCDALCRRARLPQAFRELLVSMTDEDPARRPEMRDVALRLQRLMRGEAAFGVAVEAWVREGRLPATRDIEALVAWADHAAELTTDERSFVQRAPVQALVRARRRLSGVVASLVLTSCVGVLGAAFAAQRGLLPSGATPARAGAAQAPERRADASAPRSAQQPATETAASVPNDTERVRALEAALAAREAELARLTKLGEQRLGVISALQQQITAKRAAGETLEQRSNDLNAGLDAAESALALCRKEAEREAQSSSACRRELEAQSEQLAEGAERLRLCSKSLRQRAADPDVVEDALTN